MNGLREKIKILFLDRVKSQFSNIKRKYYKFGNKVAKLLARSIKPKKIYKPIKNIKLSTGEAVDSPDRIVQKESGNFIVIYIIYRKIRQRNKDEIR